MSNQLTFQATSLSVVRHNNQDYITASDLARALQYADASSVLRIYSRYEDEFTASMSLTVKLTVKGFGNGNSEKDVRIFSLKGCHLIAMFARTPVAKEFRKWVLDILDKEAQNPQPSLPLKKTALPRKTKVRYDQYGWQVYDRELSAREMEFLVIAWYEAHQRTEFLKELLPALEAMQSSFYKRAFYLANGKHTLHTAGTVLRKLVHGADVMELAPLLTLKKMHHLIK